LGKGSQFGATTQSVSNMEESVDRPHDHARDQKWYQMGRNVEYLDWCIKTLDRKISDTTRSHRHVLVENAVCDAAYSLQKLHRRVVNDAGKEVDFKSINREWLRIFDQVKMADKML
jgi:hypothetical protein